MTRGTTLLRPTWKNSSMDGSRRQMISLAIVLHMSRTQQDIQHPGFSAHTIGVLSRYASTYVIMRLRTLTPRPVHARTRHSHLGTPIRRCVRSSASLVRTTWTYHGLRSKSRNPRATSRRMNQYTAAIEAAPRAYRLLAVSCVVSSQRQTHGGK